VSWHGPDLVVDSISFSDPDPEAGDTITAEVTVRNQGDRDAGAFSVGLYYDRPWAPEPAEPADVTRDAAGLAAGSQAVFKFDGVTSDKAETWDVYAYCDIGPSQGSVLESDEQNNVWGPNTLEWRPPPSLLLSAQSITFHGSAGDRGVLTGALEVRNADLQRRTLSVSISSALPHYVQVIPTSFTLRHGESQTVWVQVDVSGFVDPFPTGSVGSISFLDDVGTSVSVDVLVGVDGGPGGLDVPFACLSAGAQASRGGAAFVWAFLAAAIASIRLGLAGVQGTRRSPWKTRRNRSQRAQRAA
jgi:hypothetical protein